MPAPDKQQSISNPRWHWPVVTGIILLLSLTALWATSFLGEAPVDDPYPGQLKPLSEVLTAPSFELPAVDGELHRLSDYRGRLVVINFWSTWCSPCRREMPSLQRAWQRLESSGIAILGVAIQDDLKMVKRFVREDKITFPILIDTDGSVAQQWPFSGIPATFVLDRQGRVIYRALGMRQWDTGASISQLLTLAEQH